MGKARAQEWPPLEVTLTGEAADGLVTVRAELHNRAGFRLSELTLSGSVPEGAQFLGSELVSSSNPGRFDGVSVEFHHEHLDPGATLGPITWRFRADGLSGAARVHAWVGWKRPAPGSTLSPELSVATLRFLGRRPSAESAIAPRLDDLLASPALNGVRVGILVYDPESGRVEYARDADQAFVPASNAKLFVAASALDALGADHRFGTVIGATGELSAEGVLQGDLYLRGEGDPLLTATTLADWADEWVGAGLTAVKGDLVVDDSYFGGNANGPGWTGDEERAPFEPRIGALSINQNQVTLVIAPGATVGAQAQVSKEPITQRVRLYNLAATSAAGKPRSIAVVRDEADTRWEIRGTTPVGASPARRPVTVDQPALYAGDVLRRALEERGVEFANGSQVRLGEWPDSARVLKTYHSAPLRDVLAVMLKDSDNFVAEMVLYALGAHVLGGGNGAGQAAVADFVVRMGLSGDFFLRDACGLSAENQLTPELIVGLLAAMTGHPDGEMFRASLAVAGTDGTLADRMTGTPAEGRVSAKTGSLLVSSTLSGYVTRGDGSERIFSILMNCEADGGWAKVEGLRDLQDRMVAELAKP